MARVGMISLGCPKNTVDAEEMLGEIRQAGHDIETDPSCAEALIVNTCGFIQSAKEESIEAILDAVRCKTNGLCRSVIVTGCLAQRHGQELADEIPEADAFIGLGQAGKIAGIIESSMQGHRTVDITDPGAWWKTRHNRALSTNKWTAYLRVADGCDNRCSYCAIPDIRGGFASRSRADIFDEARLLADAGVKELNFVAQDVTRYGLDIDGRLGLPRLIDEVSAIDGIRWIRLLYCYPTRISAELIETIANNSKVCKYIDVPLQHCSDRILASMGRGGSRGEYTELFSRIRSKCPNVSLRTSFIVGYPGETDDDFDELLGFVSEVKFDRAGVFKYSREDGTPAASMKGQVSRRVADMRFDRLMAEQQRISLENNERLIGREIEALVESKEKGSLIGRSYRDAPEIDGLVYITDPEGNAAPGEFVNVRVETVQHYDICGKMI